MPTYLARVRRAVVDGEPAGVTLEVIEDDATVELVDGDELVSIATVVDLFQPPA